MNEYDRLYRQAQRYKELYTERINSENGWTLEGIYAD